jgi:hypothetical protein
MTANDPRQAILDHICAPPGVLTVTGQSPGGWQSGVVTGGPLSSADPDSVRFLKERHGAQQVLYAVAYLDRDGRDHLEIIGVARQPDGTWTISGGAGGSGHSPGRDRPWVNLGGWWSSNLFCGGGEVTGPGAEQAHQVELVLGDDTTVNDDIEHNVVLFLVEHAVQFPGTANILAADGRLLASHSVFDGLSS